jgi:hypothetical protein
MSEVIMSESETGASPSFRYYYTDPLAAAWMAKHHGMLFEDFGDLAHRYAGPCLYSCLDEDHVSFKSKRFYIHPDSLHLLEPQVGDFYVNDFGHGYRLCSEDNLESVERILERDGQPIHWPEREAA